MYSHSYVKSGYGYAAKTPARSSYFRLGYGHGQSPRYATSASFFSSLSEVSEPEEQSLTSDMDGASEYEEERHNGE